MKTFKLLSMLLAAASLLLASCSIDNLGSNEIDDGEECLVSFAVQVPDEISSRGDGDYIPGGAAHVRKLKYAVYKVIDERRIVDYKWVPVTYKPTDITDVVDFTNPVTSIDIKLMKGYKYKVAFWADAFGFEEGSPYSFDAETGRISIDFDGLESNREDLDAFYGSVVINNPSAGKQHTATLTRPFAQLNFGVNLTAAANFRYETIETGIEVNCTNALNIADEYDDIAFTNTATRTFNLAPRPTGYKFPVESTVYDYICLNYIPIARSMEDFDGSTTAVKFNCKVDGGEVQSRTINVPLAINYRTNIYGDLLMGTSSIKVDIDSIFSKKNGEDVNFEYVPGLTPLHEAAMYGGTFVLDDDYELSETVVVSKNLYLDLNNHTISKTATGSDKNVVFKVESGAYLVISGFGYIKALGDENSENNIAIQLEGPGVAPRLNINGGNFDGKIIVTINDGLQDDYAYISIAGGAFSNYKYDNYDIVSTNLSDGLTLRRIVNSYYDYDNDTNVSYNWDCVLREDITIPEGRYVKWAETFEQLRESFDTDNNSPYCHIGLYSHMGVTYWIEAKKMDVYASKYGTVVGFGKGVGNWSIYNGEAFQYLNFHDYTDTETGTKTGITEIAEKTFYNAECLYNLSLPSTLKKIGDYALAYIPVQTLDIPSSLEYIGEGALKGIGAWGITFPTSTTYFGAECFANCPRLMSVTIPAESFKFDASMFNDISSGVTLSVDPANVEGVQNVFTRAGVNNVMVEGINYGPTEDPEEEVIGGGSGDPSEDPF